MTEINTQQGRIEGTPSVPAAAGALGVALRDALKGRLLQLEEALFVASGQRFEAESEAAAEAAYLDATGPSCYSRTLLFGRTLCQMQLLNSVSFGCKVARCQGLVHGRVWQEEVIDLSTTCCSSVRE